MHGKKMHACKQVYAQITNNQADWDCEETETAEEGLDPNEPAETVDFNRKAPIQLIHITEKPSNNFKNQIQLEEKPRPEIGASLIFKEPHKCVRFYIIHWNQISSSG